MTRTPSITAAVKDTTGSSIPTKASPKAQKIDTSSAALREVLRLLEQRPDIAAAVGAEMARRQKAAKFAGMAHQQEQLAKAAVVALTPLLARLEDLQVAVERLAESERVRMAQIAHLAPNFLGSF